jgi:hypothetical protein
MPEFRVTFGQKWRREPHPQLPVAHPDGYVIIEAETWDQAFEEAKLVLGKNFSDVYSAPLSAEEARMYPRGVLARFVVGKTLVGSDASTSLDDTPTSP